MLMTYKYRIYPNDYQKGMFAKFFGCARKAYNLLLDIDFSIYEAYLIELRKLIEEEKLKKIESIKLKKIEAGEEINEDEEIEIEKKDIKIDYSKISVPKYIGDKEYMPMLKQLKDMEEHSYLKEADANSLQRATKNEHEAFKAYVYGKKGKPKYRSKKGNQSYTTAVLNGNVKIDESSNKIRIPKIGYVKIKYHKPIIGEMKTISIVKTNATKEYYVCVTSEVDIKVTQLPIIDKEIGIDLGIQYFYTTSDGERANALKMISKYEEKIKKLQRKLSGEGIKVYKKDKEGKEVVAYIIPTKNYKKTQKNIAKIYRKMRNIRQDYLHKLSWELVRDNQTIVAEELDIVKMEQSNEAYLSKYITDAAWGIFINMLKYKSLLYGRNFIQVDTYFPSSQKCCNCGHINKDVKDLSIREWNCPVCGEHQDRDINAAKNILAEGKRIFAENINK